MATTKHANVYIALAAAHQDFAPLVKDKKVDTGKFSYTYSDLAGLLDAVMPALIEHGLTVYQSPTIQEHGLALVSKIVHGESDTSVSDMMPLPPSGSDMRQFGSALTYARRYMLMAQLGVAGEDDDGGAAGQPAPRKAASRKQQPEVEFPRDASPAPDDHPFNDEDEDDSRQVYAPVPRSRHDAIR